MTDGLVRRDTVIPSATGAAGTPRERGARLRLAEGAVSEQLGFAIGAELYALPLESIREILKVGLITEVPRAPHDVLGILSVRGRVTTIIDLRRRLKAPESPPTNATRLLLVEGNEEIVGLLVDRVLGVFRLGNDEVELAQQVAGNLSDHVVGMGRPRGSRGKPKKGDETRTVDLLILLDPTALLRR